MAQIHQGEINLNFDETDPMEMDLQDVVMAQEEQSVAQEEVSEQSKSSKASSKSGKSKKPLTKGQLLKQLAEKTGQPIATIRAILDAHEAVGLVELKKSGEFRIPGLMTMKAKKKPALPQRQGFNPFTKKHQTFAAKPATMAVKATAQTKLKKFVKPAPKLLIWDAKQKAKLEDRVNSMQIKKSMSKAQIIDHLAFRTKLPRPDIVTVFDMMGELCVRELATRGSFKIPDVANLTVKQKSALPERQGINPFTKEPTVFKARPASKDVKANVTKSLRAISYAFTDAKSYAASSCGSLPSSSKTSGSDAASSSSFPKTRNY